jgi:hypothetical protein
MRQQETVRGDDMAELRSSIEVDAPASYANREWTEFVFRSFFNWYRIAPGQYSYEQAGDESDAEGGCVYLESLGPERTRVTVDLSYLPRDDDADPDVELRHAERHLAAQLEHYKRFVERRYAAEHPSERAA